jgi:hypothetical protein
MLRGKLNPILLCIFCFLLVGCETNPRVSNETPECRQAKGFYQMCYGGCLGSTTGTFLQAAAKCGNQCSNEARNMASICR